MKLKLLLSLGGMFILLNFYSCTKDPAGSTINSSGQIQSITMTGDPSSGVNAINEYYYNSDGTINYHTLSGVNSPTYSYKTIYSYAPNLVTLTGYDSLGTSEEVYKFYLRPDGLVDSSVANSIPVDSFLVNHFLYNNNNIPIENQVHNYAPNGGSGPVGSMFYTFANGNLTRIDYGTSNNYSTYEYYDTVSNLTPHAFGLGYSLLQSTHLIKKESFTDPSNSPSTLDEFRYDYTLDGNNRVVTQTIHFYEDGIDQGGYVTYTYTYN